MDLKPPRGRTSKPVNGIGLHKSVSTNPDRGVQISVTTKADSIGGPGEYSIEANTVSVETIKGRTQSGLDVSIKPRLVTDKS